MTNNALPAFVDAAAQDKKPPEVAWGVRVGVGRNYVDLCATGDGPPQTVLSVDNHGVVTFHKLGQWLLDLLPEAKDGALSVSLYTNALGDREPCSIAEIEQALAPVYIVDTADLPTASEADAMKPGGVQSFPERTAAVIEKAAEKAAEQDKPIVSWQIGWRRSTGGGIGVAAHATEEGARGVLSRMKTHGLAPLFCVPVYASEGEGL